jgi:eukaryotic-like serine/threonine-protein kinase
MTKSHTPSQIGPYEIVATLGAGGMGEVYRAWDPRLHREVALKILPDAVAADPGERRRFLNEARAASALTHPNILAVFDIGLDGSRSFIVTELITGKRLRDEIERGPLPTKRLLEFAAQLAAGLGTAHERAIVHGDLKPENVMVTADGRIKIVDFGLARAFHAAPVMAAAARRGATSALDDPPPHTSEDARQTSTLLATAGLGGTPQYMSPEQARGGRGDFRSDQFALGLMLYELATGVHPFRRATTAQTLSAIADEDARPISDAFPRIPTALRWVIDRCLAKDPGDRYASTTDLAKDLATLRNHFAELAADNGREASPSSRRRWTVVVTTGAALMLLGVVAIPLISPVADRPAGVLTPLVSEASFQGAPAWSPDGRSIAYVSQVDGIMQVFTLNLASSVSAQVTSSRFDCQDPFWSADGTRIFYQSLYGASEGLFSVSAAGGPPQPVLENARWATLSPDGTTLFYLRADLTDQPELGYSVWVASSSGADARRYGRPPFDELRVIEGSMRFAPDGSKLLVRIWGQPEEPTAASSPRFWMIPWPSGSPYEVLSTLRDTARARAFDWLPDSRHVVAALGDEERTGTHLWVVDTITAKADVLTVTPRSESRPAVSPDGSRVAFTYEEVDFDIVEIPLDGAPPRRILATARNELEPVFDRDGSQYVYVSDRTGALEIWLRRRHEWGERRVIGADQFPNDDATWALGSLALSPDGSRVAYQRYGRRSGYRIWVSTLAGGQPVQLAPGGLYQDAPTWSPDGEWVAFLERTDDDLRLVKVPFGRYEPPRSIADNMLLYSQVRWSPDGRWILGETLDGLALISPDGREPPKVINDEIWITYGWSDDSQRVYGLREADRPRHYMLVEFDILTGDEQILNPDLGVIPPAYQAIRGFSRADKAFVTSIAGARSELWVLDGFQRPRSWLNWFLVRPWRH